MEYEMNRMGWTFAGTNGGRLVWVKRMGTHRATMVLKSWDEVAAYVSRYADQGGAQ